MELQLSEIIKGALSLPVDSRAFLAEKLLESLDFNDDFSIDQEWIDEINKRCSDINHGKIELIPGDKGLENLLKRFA